MSPVRMAGPAYWGSGGEVRGRGGPLAPDRAAQVGQCLDRLAEESRERGDLAAAGVLGGMALELRRAIAVAADWRRAAAAGTTIRFRV